jgi:tetratricopeptide (TPR) repeat protein
MLKAHHFFQKGSKEFNLTKYKKAIHFFEISEKLFRNQIFTYWNLGRLYCLENNFEKAILNYEKALKLLDFIDYKGKEPIIKKALKQEMNKCPQQLYNEPIVSRRDV